MHERLTHVELRLVCIMLFSLSLSLSCSDFGYYRAMNSSECVEQPELKGHSLEFCLHSRKEQLQTSGYYRVDCLLLI